MWITSEKSTNSGIRNIHVRELFEIYEMKVMIYFHCRPRNTRGGETLIFNELQDHPSSRISFHVIASDSVL